MKQKESQARYYIQNRERLLVKRSLNKKSKSNYDREYYLRNKEKKKIYRQQRKKIIAQQTRERRHKDISFKLRSYVSTTINGYFMKRGVHKSRLEFLPYDIDELKQHLESLFEPWMTWENWGVYRIDQWNDNDPTTWRWQIDHIIPQSKLKFSSFEEDNFKKCWGLANLRPLSAKQNLLEGARK